MGDRSASNLELTALRVPSGHYDVAVLGGGLAGLSMALQLMRERPDTRVLVTDKRLEPAPEAAFKVGESSVENGAHYYREVVGMRDHLEQSQLRKLGLRFYLPAGDNSDITPCYPASFGLSNILAVAATTSNDVLTAYSNYGPRSVDLAAPGSGILSTYPNDKYQTLGGTSMATPFVTGVVALIRSQHPDWTASQVIEQVLGSVDKLASLSGKVLSGGRLNAVAHLSLLDPGGSAAELRRAVADGCVGAWVAPFTHSRKAHGHPDHDELWQAASDLGVPVAIHPTYEPAFCVPVRFDGLGL